MLLSFLTSSFFFLFPFSFAELGIGRTKREYEYELWRGGWIGLIWVRNWFWLVGRGCYWRELIWEGLFESLYYIEATFYDCALGFFQLE